MDILYDNLDNYNETRVIQELRSENQELKGKMEKYAVTLEKLQTDFDNLGAEYKKLEINYSSLLKTARAEIERKTQIITNLNIEKDMMVLNAIQNKNLMNIRRNWVGGKTNYNQKGNIPDAQNRKPAGIEPNPRSSSLGRKEVPQSKQEVAEPTAVAGDETDRRSVHTDRCDRSSDAKENVLEGQRPARAASIRNRRKSMPATRMAQFSSDEEGEVRSPSVELKQNPQLSRESDGWRNSDRFNSRDNRPPDHDPYNRNRNYDNNDKYRGRDRFQPQRHDRFRKFTRDFSGDRRFRRDNFKDFRSRRDGSGGYKSDKDGPHDPRILKDGLGDHRPYRDRSGDRRPYRDNLVPNREQSGDRQQKPDFRKRRLESPPRDKYHDYQQKNHEQFERDYYDEKNKYMDDGKPKYHSDYEEPTNKRLRTDSHHRIDHDRSNKTDNAPQPVVESMHLGDMSCQSPDYLTTELAAVPKEIKLDAEGKMDDPREHSSKYTVRTEHGEKRLTTVSGRNVGLKPVNKSVWNIVDVDIPVALVRRPSARTESLVDEIYGDMNVEPASEISSMESGDIVDSTTYDDTTDPFHYAYRKHDVYHNIVGQYPKINKYTERVKRSSETEVIHREKSVEDPQYSERARPAKVVETPVHEKERTHTDKVDKDQQVHDKIKIQTTDEGPHSSEKEMEKNTHKKDTVHTQKSIDETVDTIESSNVTISKYKIPKFKNKDQSSSRVKKQSDNKHIEGMLHDDIKHENIPLKHKSASKTDEHVKHENIPLKQKSASKTDEHLIEQTNVQVAVATSKGMVEGDLELSDDNSDNIDLMRRVMKEVNKQTLCKLMKPDVLADTIHDDGKNEATEFIKDAVNETEEENNANKSSETSKKSKSMKKSIKHKAVKETFTVPEKDNASDEQTKPKLKDTVVSNETKSKFCDLFGDTSSSLITPEDLGLTAQEVRIESSSSNYFPIFEDAQDAIDVGPKVIAETKLSLPTINTEELHSDKLKSSKCIEQHIEKKVEKKTKHSTEKAMVVQNEKPAVKDEPKLKLKLKLKKVTDKDQQNDNPIATNETKSFKNAETDQLVSKKVKNDEPKIKTSKYTDKQQKPKDVEEAKSKTTKSIQKDKFDNSKVDLKETKPKLVSNKNSEHELDNKCLDSNEYKSQAAETNDTKTIEVRRKKSKKHEEKPQLTIETEPLQPAVITVENITAATLVSNKQYTQIVEPEPVKTVVISSGVQPVCEPQNMAVDIITPILEPPVTPIIDYRQSKIPVLTHSVHIHALATSTPAKDTDLVQTGANTMADVSNTSNEQSSYSNLSRKETDAPDVRIFVKRKRRVFKSATPSKV